MREWTKEVGHLHIIIAWMEYIKLILTQKGNFWSRCIVY